MRRVLFIEAQMKQYRVPFYERLYAALSDAGIQLRVAYSDPCRTEKSKQDTCDLPAKYGVKVKGRWLIPEKLIFQAVLGEIVRADLVVLDQANKFLLNHLILPMSLARIKRTAFVGHGVNGREDRHWLSEWYRRITLNWVSCWFAYTESTARYLVGNGVSRSKVITVQNAIDTNEVREQVRVISNQRKHELRSQLGIPLSAPLGIYCGVLDKVKKIPFLIEAAERIRHNTGNFHLLLMGGGPEQASVEAGTRKAPWVHLLGPCFGKKKAELLAISDVMLMPGAVGLVILDAFAAGLPLLSTRISIHGPEMEYLEEGINGLLSDPDVSAFATMATSVLSDRKKLDRLRMGAELTGAKYTIENMAANFCSGIKRCLQSAAFSVRSPA